ncbi:sugar ABC transporter permease [bacterium]|uniref:carbohydrate ABC transporter permease n=1 Tax=Lachnospiraceae TaxID=186803 RepID=UPI002A3179EF|nr:sugar ABC transporter permease [bacterium]MDY2884828.1 sugar ABC transporter permease [Bariatricus sp.]MCI7150322.1 sugar ABC transporter permease [bacterium]MDD6514488.1 sugar ABC transporter permease [bacterium]MDD7143948.1 sugar ABC transporter permease [bacterium]
MEKALKRYAPIFILPTFLAFVIGFIVPFIEGLYLSFCKFTTVDNATWVGLTNYIAAIKDTSFTDSFKFSVMFSVVSILTINVLAFGLALLLTQNLRGTNIFRTVFFMPNLIGGIVLGYIWQILINCVLSLTAQPLLALNSKAGYWGMIILMCWQQIGYMMIIYIAGLQNVPDSLIEAAKIDGATNLQTLIKIKVPMVMSSITICVFLTLTNSFKLFDQNLALTGGDPNHTTEMLALNIYQTFYARSGMQWKGYGQAKAVIFCLIVIVISFAQLRATRSKEVQQ